MSDGHCCFAGCNLCPRCHGCLNSGFHFCADKEMTEESLQIAREGTHWDGSCLLRQSVVNRTRAMITLLSPEEMTPRAVRMWEQLADAWEQETP